MSAPLDLYALVRHFQLSPAQARQLATCAQEQPPVNWAASLWRGLAVVAALLLGGGLIFWIAAQWPQQTRSFKLHVLQTAVLLPLLAALAVAQIRMAALLLATLALGGLLAFVGQTYQTGADAWQLFALWAALALPWTIVARSDGLWALWLLIVGAGLSFWIGLGMTVWDTLWSGFSLMSIQHLLLWLPVWLVPVLLSRLGWAAVARPAVSRTVGAGLALAAWTALGVLTLVLQNRWGLHLGACLAVACVLGHAWQARHLVVLGLGLIAANVLWLVALGYVLFEHVRMSSIEGLALMTLLIALSVGGSAHGLYRLQKDAGQ